MPFQIDITKTPFYKWGKQERLKEAILLGILLRLGQSKANQKSFRKIENKEVIKAKSWMIFSKYSKILRYKSV